MKKTGFRSAWKNLYKSHRWIRALHIFLQYLIIFVSGPIIIFLLEYLWEERPGLLFVTIPGIIIMISILHTFLTDKKNRKTLEEEGRPSEGAMKKFIHDTIILSVVFTIYIIIKYVIKNISTN